MAEFSASRWVKASPGAVFGVFADFENVPNRVPSIRKLEILTPGPVGPGTRFRETRVMFGKDATEEMEITRFEPGKRYDVRCESCGAEYLVTYEFHPENDGTRVDVRFRTRLITLSAKIMGTLCGWMFLPAMKKCFTADLDLLAKHASESAPTTTTAAA